VSEEIVVQVIRNGRQSASSGRIGEVQELPARVGECVWNTLSESFGVLAPDVLASACRWAVECEVQDPSIEWEATGPAITHAERVKSSQMGLAIAEAFSQLDVDTTFS
jgi:hypothetical protein